MHSGYLESSTDFEVKGYCLSTGLRLQDKVKEEGKTFNA